MNKTGNSLGPLELHSSGRRQTNLIHKKNMETVGSGANRAGEGEREVLRVRALSE